MGWCFVKHRLCGHLLPPSRTRFVLRASQAPGLGISLRPNAMRVSTVVLRYTSTRQSGAISLGFNKIQSRLHQQTSLLSEYSAAACSAYPARGSHCSSPKLSCGGRAASSAGAQVGAEPASPRWPASQAPAVNAVWTEEECAACLSVSFKGGDSEGAALVEKL